VEGFDNDLSISQRCTIVKIKRCVNIKDFTSEPSDRRSNAVSNNQSPKQPLTPIMEARNEDLIAMDFDLDAMDFDFSKKKILCTIKRCQ